MNGPTLDLAWPSRGLGIWGAIAFGGVGAWIGCRRQGVRMPAFADAVAPGLLVAQAIGRLGNWFNQELFGGPTTLPWGLAAAGVLIWLDRRFKLGHGRVFALYVVLYTSGRLWIELLRIDPAHTIGPFRLN